MLTTDPLARFRDEAGAIRRRARERVFAAVCASDVPTFRRRLDAERAVTEGRRDLEHLRYRMSQGAADMAEDTRQGLFNMARMDAPHVMRDVLAEATAWQGAQHTASQVADEAAAVAVIRDGLARAERDPFACIVAGAVALRAHREGWQGALATFLESSRGRHRGGWGELERMTTWEAISRGDFPAWAGEELPDAQTMAGDYWPADVAA